MNVNDCVDKLLDLGYKITSLGYLASDSSVTNEVPLTSYHDLQEGVRTRTLVLDGQPTPITVTAFEMALGNYLVRLEFEGGNLNSTKFYGMEDTRIKKALNVG